MVMMIIISNTRSKQDHLLSKLSLELPHVSSNRCFPILGKFVQAIAEKGETLE